MIRHLSDREIEDELAEIYGSRDKDYLDALRTERRIRDLEQAIVALTAELRAHRHNAFSGEYAVHFPARKEIAALRGSDGTEMPLR